MHNRIVYFPELPLEKIQLSGLNRHPEYLSDHSMKVKFNDANRQYGSDIFESIRKYGQLDPSFGTYNESKDEWNAELGKWTTVKPGAWVVEPGQTRWMALHKLKRSTQKVLVLIREEDEPFFHMISDSEHREIKTMEEAFPLFTDKNNLPGKGYGYLKRKKWFGEPPLK